MSRARAERDRRREERQARQAADAAGRKYKPSADRTVGAGGVSQRANNARSQAIGAAVHHAKTANDPAQRFRADTTKGVDIKPEGYDNQVKAADDAVKASGGIQPRKYVDPKEVVSFVRHKHLVGGHSRAVYCCKASRCGKFIASCGHDGTIVIWSTQTGNILKTMRGHVGWVLYCDFCPPSPAGRGFAGQAEAQYVASCSSDTMVKLWDRKTGALQHTFQGHRDMVCGVAFSTGGDRLASCSKDCTIVVWDVRKALARLTGMQTNAAMLYRIKPGPNAQLGEKKEYNLAKKREKEEAERQKKALMVKKHGNRVGPGGGAGAGPEDAAAAAAAEEEKRRKKHECEDGHTQMVVRVVWSPDDAFLLSCSHDRTAKLWDATTKGAHLVAYEGHRDHVLGAAFDPGGEYVVTCSHDNNLRVWERDSGKCLRRLVGHKDIVYGLSFSPKAGGRRVLSCGHDGRVILWDIYAGQPVLVLTHAHDGWVLDVDFGPNGLWFVTASGDNSLKVFVGKHVGDSLLDKALHAAERKSYEFFAWAQYRLGCR